MIVADFRIIILVPPSGITKYCKEVYTLAEKSDQGGRRKIADLLRYYKTNIFS